MTFDWDRTFPDTHHDFQARENGETVGRIRRNHGGPNAGTWEWSCYGCTRGVEAEGVRPLSGEAATRDEAIQALSDAWRRAKAWSARTGLPLR